LSLKYREAESTVALSEFGFAEDFLLRAHNESNRAALSPESGALERAQKKIPP